jgi:hypothetical protein
MSHNKNHKFAYFIFTYDTGSLVFVDYTKKQQLTQHEIEELLALAFIPNKSRKPIVIADVMNLFGNEDRAAQVLAYIKDLRRRDQCAWADADYFPDHALSEKLRLHMKDEDRAACVPDYQERTKRHLEMLEIDTRLGAEEKLADSLIHTFKQ